MTRWHIIITVIPRSTGLPDVDQAKVGDRIQSYYLDADGVGNALKCAHCIVMGIKSNPAVWEAAITGITQKLGVGI